MIIQRYLQKEENLAENFGEYFKEHRWDFAWYMGLDKIGIVGHPTTTAESFIGGFLVTPDTLIISPSRDYPQISLDKTVGSKMCGDDANRREIRDLIELIMGQEITHSYISFGKEPYEKILTFSSSAPNTRLYSNAELMPVKVDTSYIKTEAQIKKINELFGRCM